MDRPRIVGQSLERIVNAKQDRVFPRDICGRLALGIASAFLAPIFGFVLFAIALNPDLRRTFEGWLWMAIIEEMVLALFLFFSCGLIWALAMPRWLERCLDSAMRKLTIALMLFWIPYSIVALWSLWVL